MADESKSASTVIVELALERYTLCISEDGEAFALPVEGPPVVRLLRGDRRGLRSELARGYFALTGKVAAQQALADALMVLEGIAGEQHPVELAQRVAARSGAWWVDLGDDTGDAIRIDPGNWCITAPPARFRRTVLTGAMARPTIGDLDELFELLNVAVVDQPLILGWLVAALISGIPHPVLSLAGEQGVGKSSATRLLVDLVDPSPVPLRKNPRDAESWVTAAAGSWLVAVDNVSSISDWFSDSLCRGVTGDGDVRRKLYSNGGLAVFAFRRCIILNGIDNPSKYVDLHSHHDVFVPAP